MQMDIERTNRCSLSMKVDNFPSREMQKNEDGNF